MHSIHVRHAMRQNHLFYLSICFLFFAICLCSVMGIHIIVAVPQLQYQLVHLVGKPVQRGLEFYQQVAGDNNGEAYCGNGGQNVFVHKYDSSFLFVFRAL